ncbi:MAG: TSUP family transporter [Vicinamibacterales bacterium]|nr:TSUP family transporter [Vicinamibacterales bacterium]
MPEIALPLVAGVAGAGLAAGFLGGLLGLGGGVFLVPLLVLGLNLPMRETVALSLATVVATSGAVAAGRAARLLINLRLGLLLEIATAAGGLLGGLTALAFSQASLQRLFAIVVIAIAIVTLARIDQRNVSFDEDVTPGRWGGRFLDDDTGLPVTYQVQRLPLAIAVSFIAGNLATLLGIGGGTVKVPLLTAWCGVPLRAAAATSAVMMGVTAAAGATIYYGRGLLVPALAAAAILGVQAGATLGVRVSARAPVRTLKIMMAGMLIIVGMMMLLRSL